MPDVVLAQLGNRIQHGLRTFTPRDAKALKAAVSTYPKSDDYDLEELIPALGTGQAVVTTLNEKGVPSPVTWTKVRPPQSMIGAVDVAEVTAEAQASAPWARYSQVADRESAHEMLAKKMGVDAAPAAADRPAASDMNVQVPSAPEHQPPSQEAPAQKVPSKQAPKSAPSRSSTSSSKKKDGNIVTDYLRSREGRAMFNTVVRGVFGALKKKR